MIDRIREHGIVGAGGAGFPTHVKLEKPAEVFIVNAAECEPLLHKDKELLLHHAAEMLRGLGIAMGLVQARRGIIGIKEKYRDIAATLSPLLPGCVELAFLRDSYPAGDEFLLVYDTTGRVIPPGRLPLDVGAVVNNVETLVNIGLDQPVTRKYLTIAGAVRRPVTLCVPVGTPFRLAIEAAGGPTAKTWDILVGGVMMGRLAANPDEPVTKTTGGIVVLPHEHPAMARYRQDWTRINRIGKSACDQCGYCTELCPRYLLGHPVEPHKAMRGLAFSHTPEHLAHAALFCCECNLCTMFSCPEDLDPKSVCAHDKGVAGAAAIRPNGSGRSSSAHPLYNERRIPMRRLTQKLGLGVFDDSGPLDESPVAPPLVRVPLQQHAGVPAIPCVRPGTRVREGDTVALVPHGKLGAHVHASIDGVVRGIDSAVVIET